MKKITLLTSFIIFSLIVSNNTAQAFWVWTPGSNTMVNPKFAVKDTPREQYNWAMRFFKNGEFDRAAIEFIKLTEHYPDSDFSPEAQYYAGRSYEEKAKYYFAFQNYQKTIDNYPYTKRMREIIEREYNIANIFQTKDAPKLMSLELSESLGRAVEIYGKIIENSPFGEYADKSLYKMAGCYRRMFEYDDAIDAYDRIITDYPESDLVPEARYQLAYTKYEASLDPEYDQVSTNEALQDFEDISRTTPIPSMADEADKVIDELKNRKAGSILKTAEFYDKQKKDISALMYYEDIVTGYSGTEAAIFAEERIKEIKKRIGGK